MTDAEGNIIGIKENGIQLVIDAISGTGGLLEDFLGVNKFNFNDLFVSQSSVGEGWKAVADQTTLAKTEVSGLAEETDKAGQSAKTAQGHFNDLSESIQKAINKANDLFEAQNRPAPPAPSPPPPPYKDPGDAGQFGSPHSGGGGGITVNVDVINNADGSTTVDVWSDADDIAASVRAEGTIPPGLA